MGTLQPDAHHRTHVRPSRLLPVLTLVALAASVGPARADAIRCEREIVRRSAKLVQSAVKALQRCEDAVLKGKIAGPCPDARTGARIARARAKLGDGVVRACGGEDRVCGTGDDVSMAAIGWDLGSCPNIENGSCSGALVDCTDVGTCLLCADDVAVDRVIDLSYGALAPTGDGDVLKCQRAIGKGAAKFLSTKSKALRKCRDQVLKDKITGPCPDEKAVTKITKAESKLRAKVCKACGGGDRSCGGGDDLTPGTIGFAPSCPAVTVPGGPSCAGPINDLAALVDCVACVTEFEADCVDALAAPRLTAYPEECPFGGATPTPTPTVTPTPGGPTSTAGGPTTTTTPTTTPTPAACGNGVVDPGEDCDLGDDDLCPGACQGDCTCPEPCVLPAETPEIITILARPGGITDSGWTGVSHDIPSAENGILSVARLVNCDLDTGSPTCGQCALEGPIASPLPATNCFCFDVASPDDSSRTTCDPEGVGQCGAPETCTCFNSPPLHLVAGGIPVCTVQRYITPITGTANIAESGPRAGEIDISFRLIAAAHLGVELDRPCPTCEGDGAPLDGVAGGTCRDGSRDGLACDEGGSNPFFGPVSLDCPPRAGASVGDLRIFLEPETTGVSTLDAAVPCTGSGFGGFFCPCDTCATAIAEPCTSDADCPVGRTCGGLRCIGGAMKGTPCAVNADCGSGSFCGRPGLATQPNPCNDTVCTPDPSDPHAPGEGVCASGPFQGNCSTETYRVCTTDADCNPPPSGSCDSCQAGQACRFAGRQCFLDPIVRQGRADPETPTFAATFCIPPATSSSVNTAAGLPGPEAIHIPAVVFKGPATCGNGALDPGETCDFGADLACPGACQASCQCPVCGDGILNDPSEVCDGDDDAVCPGTCQPDCSCDPAVCGDGQVQFGEECDGASDAACPGACQGDCTCGAVCGDGTVDPGEECDGPASQLCPPAACQGDCTCGPFCGDDTIDPGEECDGAAPGACAGTCENDCTCSPFCGDDQRQAGELCDGTDDALCPGACSDACTCPPLGALDLIVKPGADLDAGWTGIAHQLQLQAGSVIAGDLSNCDGQSDVLCDFFGNIGSFCGGDPSRSCTRNDQCQGAGSCTLQFFGPPLPVSAGGVPACVVNRFASDATGTYNFQTGDMEIAFGLNSLAFLGTETSRPCPLCDCGKPDLQDCQIGESGSCSDNPLVTCTVEGTGPFGPTSLSCPPNPATNITGNGLALTFDPISTGLVSFPSSQPCDAGGFTHLGCWCDGQTQPNQCAQACDGGSNDGAPCSTDASCPGAPFGSCRPLCRQITGEAIGEGECVAGPVTETCAGAPEISCSGSTPCPPGTGPCEVKNQRCFLDPIDRIGSPGTTMNTLAAGFCVPATGSAALDQTAGLPGPTAVRFDNTVVAVLCGDGIRNRAEEECDGGDDANCPGTCQLDCTCARTCGNDVAEFGEQCDGLDSLACPGLCAAPGGADECTCPPICGDGFAGPGEVCDPGGPGGAPAPDDAACPGECLVSCECPPPVCGNGTVEAGEACELPAIGCGPLQLCVGCLQCAP